MKRSIPWVVVSLGFLLTGHAIGAKDLPNTIQQVSHSEILDHVSKWSRLQELDPKTFQELISKKKEALHREIKTIKKTDPTKYQLLKRDVIKARRTRYQLMKESSPEAAKRRARMQVERLNQLKRNHPEIYHRWIAQAKQPVQPAPVDPRIQRIPPTVETWKDKHPFHGKTFNGLRRQNMEWRERL